MATGVSVSPSDPVAQAYGHSERIFDLAFHPKRKNIIASASEDLTARIWALNPATGIYKQINCCRGHEAEVLRVQWSEDGSILATGSADGVVSLWEPSLDEAAGSYSAREVGRVPGHPEEVYAIEFVVGRPGLLLTGSGESLFLWDHAEGQLLQVIQAESGAMVQGPQGPEPLPAYIFCLAQHPTGSAFATACSDGVLRIWSLSSSSSSSSSSLSLQHELGLHQGMGTACAFSRDGSMLLSGSKTGDFVLLEYPSCKVLAKGNVGHPIMAAVFFASGGASGRQWLATAGSADGIQLYDLLSLCGVSQRSVRCGGCQGSFLAVAVSGDGSCLAAAGEALAVSALPVMGKGVGGSGGGAGAGAGAAARRRRSRGSAAAAERQLSQELQGLQIGKQQQQQQQQQQQGGDDDGLFGSFSLETPAAAAAAADDDDDDDPGSSVVASNAAADAELQEWAAAAGFAAGAGVPPAAAAAAAAEEEDGMGHGAGHGQSTGGPATRAPIFVWDLS